MTSALIYAVVQVARTIERRTPLYTAGASSYELSVDGKFLSVEQEVCVDSSTPQSTAILYGLSGNAGEKYPGSVAVATVPSGCSTIGLTAIPVPSAFLPTTDPCAPLIMEGVFQAIVADRPAELFTVVVDQCDPKA